MVGGNLELKKPIIPDMVSNALLEEDEEDEAGCDGSCDASDPSQRDELQVTVDAGLGETTS